MAVVEVLWHLANSRRDFPLTCQTHLWKIITSPVSFISSNVASTQSVTVDEREEQDVATQLTEVTPETLERNALNFLAWVRQSNEKWRG